MADFFIDESGNLGNDGDHFVFSLFYTENKKRFKNIIKRAKTKWFSGVVSEIKGHSLALDKRQFLFSRFNKQKDYFVSYIVIKKEFLDPELLRDKNLAYNYLLSFLVKKIVSKFRDEETLNFYLDQHDIANSK
ncbi:hypothetical protein K9L63_03290 [Candidatus Gracilibacteria bacterium]|nr:hypothetical protein [Candidatus Gracilibacteria bacterium]